MKKIFLFVLLTIAVLGHVNAQNVIANDYSSPITGVEGQDSSEDLQEQQGGTDFEYQAYEDGGGIGMNYVFNHVILGGSVAWGEESDYKKDVTVWNAYLGANHRYFLGTRSVWIEGRAMVGYKHGSMKVATYSSSRSSKIEWEKESEGGLFLGISPRFGVNLIHFKNGDILSVVAGYRWDFYKFKFNKENTSKYFTIGVDIAI